MLGGTLIQHIPDEVPGALPHEQPNPRTEPGHKVKVDAGTLPASHVRVRSLQVNSAHHQAVKDVGPGVIVNATAPDGVIEGIEHPGSASASACSGTPNTPSAPATRGFSTPSSMPAARPALHSLPFKIFLASSPHPDPLPAGGERGQPEFDPSPREAGRGMQHPRPADVAGEGPAPTFVPSQNQPPMR